MHAFHFYSYSENAFKQCNPTANILDIVQYIDYIHYSAQKLS